MTWVAKRVSAHRPSLADDFLASYVTWRDSCEAVRTSYEAWRTCAAAQRSLAFDSYVAALDQEEIAAQIHADRSARLRDLGS
jgi:hypothetical protein